MIKKILVEKETRNLNTDNLSINALAVKNDNDVDVLRFEFDEFVDGQGTMLTDIKGEDGLLAPFILEKNLEDKFYEIKVTKELLINPILTIQLQIIDGEKVWHSKQACLLVYNCLTLGEGKMPSGIDNWLEQANKKIQEIEDAIKEFEEKDPTVPEHVKNITEEDIANWNNVTANDVKFADGETFQEKYDSGELKGEQGPQGPQGSQGPKGDTGLAGKDGTNGADGKDGVDGKTPIKGTDYFTEADKQELVSLVLAEIPNAEGIDY